MGSGDVTLEEQEGQCSLSSLEANTGLGGCKLPLRPSAFCLATVNENVAVLDYPLILCWTFLLLQQSQEGESRPAPWLLHPVVDLYLT